MDPYCRCLKWPPLAVMQAVKTWPSIKTAPQLTWRTSRRTCYKQTALGSLRRTKLSTISPDLNLLDYHVRSAMLEKYHKIQSSWSLRRLMSWKSLCRPSGKSYHKNTSTRWWQTSPSAWLPMAVALSICSKGPFTSLYHHLCTKRLALFTVTHRLPEKTISKMLKSSK